MRWHTHVHICHCGSITKTFDVSFLEQGTGLIVLFEARCKCGTDITESCNMDEIAKNCYLADAQETANFIPCNNTVQ